MRLPVIMDALVALWRADANLGARVFDGPEFSSEAVPEVLCVGFDGSSDPTAVESTYTGEGLSVANMRESHSIRNSVSVLNADGDLSAARERAFQLVQFAVADLLADPSLGGLPVLATLGSSSVQQLRDTAGGPTVVVPFTVDVEAI